MSEGGKEWESEWDKGSTGEEGVYWLTHVVGIEDIAALLENNHTHFQ